MKIFEDEINTPASEESPSTIVEEELPVTPKEVVCPFCGCKEGIEIGGNFKLCSSCGNKYPNDDGVYEAVKFVLESKPVSSKGSKKGGSKQSGGEEGEGSSRNRIISIILTSITLLLLIIPIVFWSKDDLFFSTYGFEYHSLYGLIGYGHGFPISILACTLVLIISLVVTLLALVFRNKSLKNGGLYTGLFVGLYLFVVHILYAADALFETMKTSAYIVDIIIHAVIMGLMIGTLVFSKSLGENSKLPKGVLPLWIFGAIAFIGILTNYIVASSINDSLGEMYHLITYGYIGGFIVSYIFIGLSIYALINYSMLNKKEKALSRTIALIGNGVLLLVTVLMNIIPAF